MDAGGGAAWDLFINHLATRPWLGICTLLLSFLVNSYSIESLSALTSLSQLGAVTIRLAAKSLISIAGAAATSVCVAHDRQQAARTDCAG